MRAGTSLPGVRDCAATARRAELIGQSDIDTDVALSNPSVRAFPRPTKSLRAGESAAQAESNGV
jgi:hypothetical protein